MKNYLLNYTDQQLTDILSGMGEPSYRASQIYKAIYAQNLDTFNEFTILPLNLRQKLDQSFTLRSLYKVDEIISPIDKTRKFLWRLTDGYKIESVVIYEGKRITFCISSQVGCALDCKFCATGKMGILRNLVPGEIVEQVFRMQKEINVKPTNIVYMGMGEPMLNYENVIASAKLLTDPNGYGLGSRKITISTSGIIPGISRFTEECQPFSLAISLNSVEEEQRQKIMPVSKKYSITDLLDAAKKYTSALNRIITFEYVLIDKINASTEHAKKLIRLTHQIPCRINVIPCNSLDPEYPPPSVKQIKEFEQYINEHSRRITLRKRKGWEIQAACGQLYASNERKKRRSQNTAV